MNNDKQTVALFVTCLVDSMRPATGFAAVSLIEAAGFRAVVPDNQTCCGQPAYNAGDRQDARGAARRMLEIFAGFDYVVAPSGSCAGMVRKHYPALFAGQPEEEAAKALSAKTFELCEFLHAHGGRPLARAWDDGPVVYHDSCAARREMNSVEQPRALLSQIPGLELVEMSDTEACCGFGGLFSIKLPEISDHMVTLKAQDIAASGAKVLTGPDMGWLLNIAGKLRRLGLDIRAFHIAEVLAGMTGAGIGEDAA